MRRETISAYLKVAGVEIWPPGRWKREGKAKAAIEVITGSEAAKPAIAGFAGPLNYNPNPENLSSTSRISFTATLQVRRTTSKSVADSSFVRQ